MAGYKGYSMSNNAVSAYENGEKPYSRWTKAAIVSELENDDSIPQEVLQAAQGMPAAELKNVVLVKSSWHHTSAHYNRTDFYTVNPERLCDHLGYRETMFCNTPDGEKPGMWSDRNENGIGFKHFTAADGTVYERESVSFSRFAYTKQS